jgi:predicted dehydrogenase
VAVSKSETLIGIDVMRGETFDLKRLAVVGGGRWARVMIGALHQLVRPDVCIRIYSPNNAPAMRKWVADRYPENIEVLDVQPNFRGHDTADIAVIANAARDHITVARRAISAGVPTLVEKPLALTAADASAIVDLAERHHVMLSSSRVPLFARYIHEFARQVADLDGLEGVHVTWADPADEARYGEAKRFDPGLTLPHDLVPHILPILDLLLDGPITLTDVAIRDGGSQVVIQMQAGDIPCIVSLARNAPERRRIVAVRTAQHSFELDFSQEPGQITVRGESLAGDPLWDIQPRPLTSMLQCFLNCVAIAESDERLSAKRAIAECRFVDEVLSSYLRRQGEWLAARSEQPFDDGIRYALTETLTWYDRTMLLDDNVIASIWTAMNTQDHAAMRDALARGDRNSVVKILRFGIA